FYKWADDIYKNKQSTEQIIEWIYGTINLYSNENSFRTEAEEDFFDWYHWRRLLRYTLYEYEYYLLEIEGKRAKPKLAWEDMTDASFEHILPQNPEKNSEWKKKWKKKDIETYLHDISNIVLTKD